ncbi:alkaline shock response membrane anchor protein AmaP [Corynebacterium silvaticum]|uniref:Alkaline shock response membrane anchor protein AmaP n=1 Tax=Corynebacterium silvaticum TaxID=2320431 RepID=A0A7Y4LI79_9CORY|nr:alkaline shock response membrane anchor protein AmaP [Corynebacterium silvaticum]ARU45503.1 alkaline shock response membrane anchor protein AmaP [Corynebacterium silvaticum]MBH5300083.1 alkaline shock response membrane anchor protein AmaP [Corynebacterium silvaticum]NOM65392.1 alkaline shock response membrane anchor protein AmaP [Corynebacterium silvaticum]NON70549.1 alkaline shock response membrane anchor protein AmaP [Corynebacterium silvaticum]TFA92403.1 alkaline shock response membrane 
MKRSTASFDRLLCLLIGALLGALAAWTIALNFDLPWAQQLADLAEFPRWHQASQQRWFDVALFFAAVLFLISGVWIVVANMRRNHISRVTQKNGTISVNIDHIAELAAEDIEELDPVISAHGHVERRGEETVIALTILLESVPNALSIQQALQQLDQDIAAVLPDTPIRTEYRVHMAKVED